MNLQHKVFIIFVTDFPAQIKKFEVNVYLRSVVKDLTSASGFLCTVLGSDTCFTSLQS